MRPWSPSLKSRALGALILTAAGCVQPTPSVGPTPEQATAAARAAISAEKTIDVSAIPVRAIAVPPLAIASTDTNITPLAYGLADLLATDLARSSRLTVIERLRMDAVLRELSLAASGAVDSTTAPRVGKLIGARRLVVGGLSEMPGGELQISAQVADVATGSVQNAVTAHAPLARIFDAETALAFQIFSALGVTLTPGERAIIEAAPTRNIAALLAYSRGVRDESLGRYGSAAQQYRDALRADPNFANARVRMNGMQTGSAASSGAANRRAGGAQRAAQVAANNVNASLADVVAGGAAGAIAIGAVPSPLTSVQHGVLATLLIFIQPTP